LIGLTAAFAVAHVVYGAAAGSLGGDAEVGVFALSLPAWIVAAKVYGLYDKDEERTDHSTADDFVRVLHLVTLCAWLLYGISLITRLFNPEFGKLFLFWLLAVAMVSGGRALARGYCRRQLHYLQNTVIVGAGEVGQALARKLLKHPEYGLNLVGFVDPFPREREPGLDHLTLLGTHEDIPALVSLLDIERAIIAFTNERHEELLELVNDLRDMNVQVDIVPRLFDSLGPSLGVHTIEGIPLIGLPPRRMSRSSLLVKRVLDVVVAWTMLILASPLLLAIAVWIRLDSPGPVFYKHDRVGRNGVPFRLWKFRTMLRESCRGEEYGGLAAEKEFERLMADPERSLEFAETFKLRDDPRVTRVGRFLRRTSLDELPQLLNVLTGDISLVGPRALTEHEFTVYYGDAADDVLSIRPGITGYWQINGRSDLAYVDRVRLDLAYIGGWSLGLDLAILAKTVRVICSRVGAV
jgi:exopolysaccharide biosynthesis polyprenyl glycosylphosphotransferase